MALALAMASLALASLVLASLALASARLRRSHSLFCSTQDNSRFQYSSSHYIRLHTSLRLESKNHNRRHNANDPDIPTLGTFLCIHPQMD